MQRKLLNINADTHHIYDKRINRAGSKDKAEKDKYIKSTEEEQVDSMVEM